MNRCSCCATGGGCYRTPSAAARFVPCLAWRATAKFSSAIAICAAPSACTCNIIAACLEKVMSAAAPGPPFAPIEIEPPSFGGYAERPGEIRGVSFWPRVGARILDMIVTAGVGFFVGLVFAFFVVVAARMNGQPAAPMLARQSQGGLAVF